MNSAIYSGTVRHRRFAPVGHAFRYRMFMMYLDLAELAEVFHSSRLWSASRPSLAWFRRADYLGDASVALGVAVRDLVERETGARPAGPIRVLTHLRYFGYMINPVSFYYCFDEDGGDPRAIVAEITNTPWKQRHAYVLGPAANEGTPGQARYRFGKRFHVSPFMGMEHRYDWRFTAPGRRLSVHMENHHEGQRLFDATLVLRRREITSRSLAAVLLRHPFMTAKVAAGIYWQAARLWLKRVPFHTHPDKAEA